jgi:hypothetical protein
VQRDRSRCSIQVDKVPTLDRIEERRINPCKYGDAGCDGALYHHGISLAKNESSKASSAAGEREQCPTCCDTPLHIAADQHASCYGLTT